MTHLAFPTALRRVPGELILALALVAVIVAGPWLAPHDPLAVDLGNALQPPSTTHLTGTDQLGRDVLSRVLTGGQTTVGISFAALALSVLVGVPIGLYAGFLGKRTDWTLMRISDTFMAFPEYVVAIVITGLLGPGYANLIFAIVVVKWVGYARLARSIVLQERAKDYLLAARISGSSTTRTLKRHLVPHIAGPILALATLDLGKVVLLVASLSFLGLGIPQPSPEWGAMLNEGRTYFAESSMLMLVPGLAILIVVLATSIVGDKLTERYSAERTSRVDTGKATGAATPMKEGTHNDAITR